MQQFIMKTLKKHIYSQCLEEALPQLSKYHNYKYHLYPTY